jgi:ribosomal protein L12E/L44/L45/RPP1/RPP2
LSYSFTAAVAVVAAAATATGNAAQDEAKRAEEAPTDKRTRQGGSVRQAEGPAPGLTSVLPS